MQLKEDKNRKRYKVKRLDVISQREKINEKHSKKDGKFHNHPTKVASHGHAPPIMKGHAVGNSDKLQNDKNNAGKNSHCNQEIIIKQIPNFHTCINELLMFM